MSLLSFTELSDLIDAGIITNCDKELLNSSTLDIRLGPKILIEHVEMLENGNKSLNRVSLKNKDQLKMREYDLEQDGPFIMYPGEFVLAHSIEIFNLPTTISAKYMEKSSMARIGLNHLNAGWCDAGWHGSVLTLELHNVTRGHEIVLEFGDKIGQMKFYRHKMVPVNRSYAALGRYNNNKSVSQVQLDPTRIVFGDEEEDTAAELYAATHVALDPGMVLEVPAVSKSAILIGEDDEQS